MSNKVELKLQHFDDWMIRNRHWQHRSDWEIETTRQYQRQRNMVLSGAVGLASAAYTMAPSTVNRWFGEPHFFDNGIDSAIKTKIRDTINGTRRFTPNGYGRVLAIGVPTYAVFAALEHYAEVGRWGKYLKQQTVFGEQARRFYKTGVIEEMLAANIGAPLPDHERQVIAGKLA